MKNIVLAFLMLTFTLFAVPGCSKSANPVDNETGLIAETTPAINSNNLNILGPDFPLKVEIKTTMPPKGVKIEVVAKKDGSTDPAFFTITSNSSAPQNNFTITNTPAGFTCSVTVTITSLSKSTNTWTGSYRYSKK